MHTIMAGDGRGPGPISRPGVSLPLDERLRAAGWWPASGGTLPVVVGSEVYLATPAVRGVGGWQVVRVDWPGRPGVPPQEVRRRLHALIAGRDPRLVAVFGDAAGVREVWGWRSGPGLQPAMYREEHRGRFPPGPRDLAPADRPQAATSRASRVGARAVAASFIAGLRRGPRPPASLGDIVSAADLSGWIADGADVDGVRQVWRRLEGFRVLDPAAGSGEWLLGALEGLVAIGAACLDRMEGWIEDRWILEPDRRRAWADLRKLIARRDEMAAGAGRDRLVYEVVLLGCLRGRELDPRLARVSRLRLAARVPADGSPREIAGLVDVRPRRPLDGGASPEPPPGALGAEAALLARAEVLLRRMRLHGGGSLRELNEGRREVWRRRWRLRRRAGGENLWIDYPGEFAAGGFHLIRGAADDCHDTACKRVR